LESGAIPEWAGCTQDAIMKRMKAIEKDQLKDLGLKEFYKSYFSWEKMTNDQKNKTLSYFRALPEELQGMSLVLLLHFFLNFILFISFLLFFSYCSDLVVAEAQQDTVSASQMASNRNTQTSKDDIVCLIHLFKEPAAQRHWTNLHGIMTRAELDARKAAPAYAEGANPLIYLAGIFNNYDEFKPQNLMVKYASSGVNQPPVKVTPYQPSTSEWAYLATFTNNLESTNLSHRNIIRGKDCIKSTWTDCRKYLHQMFTNYNRSGQHDDDKDDWGSEKELRRWSRAAKWNPGNAGSIIRFPSAMIYSIAVLDIGDFDAIGRKMPKGTRVDATVDNGATAPKFNKKKRKCG
jgi:hypothetical protein